MLNILLAEVTAIEPGIWEGIKANLLLVGGSISGAIVTIKLTLSTIKGAIKTASTFFAKKKELADAVIAEKREAYESKKLELIETGNKTKLKLSIEKEITELQIKLPYLEGDAKIVAETRIADLVVQKAQL